MKTLLSTHLFEEIMLLKGKEFISHIGVRNVETLDELYGSGEFDEKEIKEDSDKHFASSVEGLARLFIREEVVATDLMNFKEQIKEKIAGLKESGKLGETRLRLMTNLQNYFEGNFSITKNVKFPELLEFLDGALVGLYRIQMVYNVPFSQMVVGNISAHPTLAYYKSAHCLKSEDCEYIANLAKEKQNLEKSVQWLNMAEKLSNQEGKHPNKLKRKLEQEIKIHDNAALKHGKFYIDKNSEIVTTRINPFSEALANRYQKKFKNWRAKWKSVVDKFPMYKESKNEHFARYLNLVHQEKITDQCQKLKSSRYLNESVLTCRNLERSNPYLKLGPQKLEILSENPSVAIFHDFLSGSQCDRLKDIGQGKMKATPLTNPKGQGSNNI